MVNRIQQKRVLFYWLLVAVYVASLPYAIIVFNALIDVLSLDIARWLPWFLVLAIGVAYLGICYKLKSGFHVVSFLIPAAAIGLLVVVIQPNPIKHIHLPEYALLAVLLHFAFARGRTSLFLIFLSAGILGVSDEIMQGLNPSRFYGLKDMLINSAGAMIGCLGLRVFTGRNFTPLGALSGWFVGLFTSQLILLFISLDALVDVQTAGYFAGTYPIILLTLNAVAILNTIVLLKLAPAKTAPAWLVLNVFLAINHALIVASALLDSGFR